MRSGRSTAALCRIETAVTSPVCAVHSHPPQRGGLFASGNHTIAYVEGSSHRMSAQQLRNCEDPSTRLRSLRMTSGGCSGAGAPPWLSLWESWRRSRLRGQCKPSPPLRGTSPKGGGKRRCVRGRMGAPAPVLIGFPSKRRYRFFAYWKPPSLRFSERASGICPPVCPAGRR